MSDILEENVTLVEDISRARTSYPSKEAIYFISPNSDSITALINDFTRPKPMYAKAHVFFTSPLSDTLFDKIKEGQSSRSFIETLKELNIDFMRSYSRTQTITEIEIIARKLISVFSTLGEMPHIRYYDPLGDQSSLGYKLANCLQKELDSLHELDSDFPPKSQFRPPILIILDRSFDLMSPLVHEFTYQAMINDLLVMEDGKYVYQAENNTEETPKDGTPPQMTKALLDESDAIWMLIRHWHFADAVEYVRDSFNKFLNENKAASNILNSDPLSNFERGFDNLNDMKDTITSLPQFQEMKSKVRLDAVAAVEQDLATGETAAGTVPRNIMIDMTPVLIDSVIPAYDKLRILMLYIIAQEGIHDMDRKRLLDASKMSIDDSQAITNLGLFGVRLSLNQEKRKKIIKDKYTYYGRVAERRKKKKKKNDGNLPYDLSRFITMFKYIMEDQLTGTLDTQIFPWLKAPPAEDLSQQTKASNIQKSIKSTNQALQPLPNAGNTYSLRTTRASWATKPKLANLNDGTPVTLNSAQDSENDLRKNGPRIIVFVMGGITFSEIRATYEIIKEYKRDVILGSTSMINSTQFINVLKQIHIKDENRGIGSVDSLLQSTSKLNQDIDSQPKPISSSANALNFLQKDKDDLGKKPFANIFKKKGIILESVKKI
ncbi:vacuolar sorting protein VPS33/slp1 [Physocladia obscura]|uniref:Vacuolar sorting protein VPS33/slp1 n=1 Tax=Physocladia obscura TaxID=109957 RepID=A0AAD5XGJ9_9FUNG|nr:vacuolar sorting protein VPS33/slp1 [Physocladia obscura]